MSQDQPVTRQTRQSFFFESDIFSSSRLIARRARPDATVQEPASDYCALTMMRRVGRLM